MAFHRLGVFKLADVLEIGGNAGGAEGVRRRRGRGAGSCGTFTSRTWLVISSVSMLIVGPDAFGSRTVLGSAQEFLKLVGQHEYVVTYGNGEVKNILGILPLETRTTGMGC